MFRKSFRLIFVFSAFVAAVLPASATLRVLSHSREEFYVFHSPQSGNVRELTFSAVAPGSPLTNGSPLPTEGKAIHENLILNYALEARRPDFEVEIKKFWGNAKYLSRGPREELKGLRHDLVLVEELAKRLEQLIRDPQLSDEQKALLQSEERANNSRWNAIPGKIQQLEKNVNLYRGRAMDAEASLLKSYRSLLEPMQRDIEKAFDSQTHLLFVPLSTDHRAVAPWLETIAKSGVIYSDSRGHSQRHYGLSPSAGNDWSVVSPQFSTDLKIDRQGEL